MSQVESHYDSDPKDEWSRLEEHRTEFAVTMLALHEYLPSPPASILDVGGGPGRYAIALTLLRMSRMQSSNSAICLKCILQRERTEQQHKLASLMLILHIIMRLSHLWRSMVLKRLI